MPRRRRHPRPHPSALHRPDNDLGPGSRPRLGAPMHIATFRDALVVGLELSEELPFAHAAVVLDASHLVLDLTAFTDPAAHSIAEAVAWSGELLRDARAEKLLLFSVDAVVGTRFEASDLLFFERLTGTGAAAGIEVLDWIRTDRTRFRSLAFATDPHRAWPGDPPAERLANLTMMAENEADDLWWRDHHGPGSNGSGD